MRLIYLIIGFLSLALAIVGVVLPLLPTTPFLLLSIACFSRSSKRFEDWLYHTKLYQTYVADFRETKSITRERKKKIHRLYLRLDGNFYLFCTSFTSQNRSGCFDHLYHLLSLQGHSRQRIVKTVVICLDKIESIFITI
ncbi:hypothetical protein SPAR1_1099 [Streptococcus pneumoniae GA02254]|nr:hypothetical protein SPAR1_1099 [Streptococcus pneumoniae GA02254]